MRDPTSKPTSSSTAHPQVAIIGAGASGLMTAISIGRAIESSGGDPKRSGILLLDGAKKIGIKILVAGGGRCNVTHHEVDEKQYASTKLPIVRSALKRFSAQDTIEFFEGLGVHLKQEPTGKMFPTTDDAHTVLHALLDEADRLGITVLHPWRVDRVTQTEHGFTIHQSQSTSNAPEKPIHTQRIVLATGGKALPKSGSDGQGYQIAQSLGHSITDHILPALVPLVVASESKWITDLSGISSRATISAVTSTGKHIKSFTNDLLCTHFGLSGPGPMDISRWFTTARLNDRETHLQINWIPESSFEQIDQELNQLGKAQIATHLRQSIPERLARTLCEQAGIDPATPGHALTRDARRALAHLITATKVFINDDRGFTHAEVTAGGIPIEEVSRKDFHSKMCPNLWIVGEILDVDGRIGGFNFQWAWSTGYIVGNAVAKTIMNPE
ncbi:MAG: NAD(P)/FAD-dependent oxidoreductase [Phycisphaerales bacterium]